MTNNPAESLAESHTRSRVGECPASIEGYFRDRGEQTDLLTRCKACSCTGGCSTEVILRAGWTRCHKEYSRCDLSFPRGIYRDTSGQVTCKHYNGPVDIEIKS